MGSLLYVNFFSIGHASFGIIKCKGMLKYCRVSRKNVIGQQTQTKRLLLSTTDTSTTVNTIHSKIHF